MENKLLLYLVLVLILNFKAFAQKQVAITIDDPNTYKTPSLSWNERNGKILKTLDQFNIKAALFVCGMRVNDANGKTLVSTWDQQNHLICNHSFSHYYYHSNKITSDIFIRDFKKGDSVINTYSNYTKLFRFPYLKEGDTSPKRDAMRTVLTKEGYSNGYVTIDASDWYIDSKIIEVLKQNPQADLTPYENYYIKHILDRANYYDSLATLLFNRKIKHTLLIHHSLLNALFLGDVLIALKENGWQLIDAKEAYHDDVFKQLPLIEPCGESIIWQCAKMNPKIATTLRYPAEDGEYEKEPLEKMVQEHKLQKTDTFNIEGKYQDKNLYVINPKTIVGKDTLWTAQKVFVNNQLIFSKDSLKKDAFEIPLTKLNLKNGDPVSVKILQRSGSKVRIIQEMNCGPKK